MKKYIFITVSIFLLVLSCKKEDLSYLHKYPGLPDATQSGENTMGCLINGVPWVADIENPSFFSGLSKLEAFYGENRKGQNDYDRYYLDILCLKRAEKDIKYINGYRILEQFSFRLRPISSSEINDKNKLDKFYIEYVKSNENEVGKQYIIDTLSPVNIEITKLDTVRNLVSGLFDFRLKEIDDSKDTLRITNGRFDANYSPK